MTRLDRVYYRYSLDPAFAHLRADGNKLVPGTGQDDSPKLFLIGEAPGANEARVGKPFVGRAGEILDWMLEVLGLLRDQVWITNAVKYRPPRNRTPFPEELEASRPYLRDEARIVDPMIIVPMGAAALRLIAPNAGGIMRWHGQPMYDPKKLPVFPLYHPMYVGYGGKPAKRIMKADCLKLREML